MAQKEMRIKIKQERSETIENQWQWNRSQAEETKKMIINKCEREEKKRRRKRRVRRSCEKGVMVAVRRMLNNLHTEHRIEMYVTEISNV